MAMNSITAQLELNKALAQLGSNSNSHSNFQEAITDDFGVLDLAEDFRVNISDLKVTGVNSKKEVLATVPSQNDFFQKYTRVRLRHEARLVIQRDKSKFEKFFSILVTFFRPS